MTAGDNSADDHLTTTQPNKEVCIMAGSSLAALSRSKHLDDVYMTLLDQLSALNVLVGDVEDEHERLVTQMLELETAGMIAAKPFYQGGKYLMLLHPTHKGRRKREYIGSNRQKVIDVMPKIERYQKFCSLMNELKAVEQHAEKLSHLLDQLIERIKP